MKQINMNYLQIKILKLKIKYPSLNLNSLFTPHCTKSLQPMQTTQKHKEIIKILPWSLKINKNQN